MTPQQLESAIRSGAQACVECLDRADETQRRQAAQVALKWHKAWRAANYGQPVDGVAYQTLAGSAPLALLGTGSWTEVRQQQCTGFDLELTLAVLRRRRPDWLEKWGHWLQEDRPMAWPLIRSVVREGWSTKSHPAWTLALITAPARHNGALQLLQDDPELLEDVWTLFTVEGAGEHSLAAYDKYVSEERSWSHALKSHPDLPRQRLLDASLEALARDFETFRAGWFSRFHEALQPTPDERLARAGKYLDLLNSRVKPTVSFALKALNLIRAHLQPDDLTARLGPALAAREKSTVLGALKLLQQVVHKPPADLLAEALTNQSPDVQKEALAALRRHYPQPPQELRDHPPEVAASLQDALLEWLGQPAAPAPKHPDEELEPLWLLDGPRGPGNVKPVAHLEELVQLYASVLEHAGPPADIERVLDGVARLRPDPRLTSPLVKRARQRLKKGNHPPFCGWILEDLSALAVAWLDGELLSPPTNPPADLAHFLGARVYELARRVTQLPPPPSPLLALPTHAAGWIDGPSPEQPLKEGYDSAQARLRRETRSHAPDSRAHLVRGRYNFLEWQLPVQPRLDQPETLFYRPCQGGAAERRWQATIWPAGRSHWLAQGLVSLANNLDWWEADWSDRVYLEALLDPTVGLDPIARKVLALGLTAKQPEQSGLAVDAAHLALGDGRLNGRYLGESLAEVFPWVTTVRWSKTLSQVAAAHPYPIFRALEELLSHHLIESLLELLHELSSHLNLPLGPERARQNLAKLQGSGKAARLARLTLNRV